MDEDESARTRMVEVTELGLGGGPLGGLFQPVDDDAAAATLAAAWDHSIRYFDSAPHYGIGQSERRIGQFLRQQPSDEFTVSTKVGRLLDGPTGFHQVGVAPGGSPIEGEDLQLIRQLGANWRGVPASAVDYERRPDS
jgi:aryl-alcohol dehydrogenase-like predicted oxidoreductase